MTPNIRCSSFMALLVLLAICSLTGCTKKAPVVRLNSSAMTTLAEKQAALAPYLTCQLPCTDLDFSLVYHDPSNDRLPGPLYYDICVAADIAPDELATWTAGTSLVPDAEAVRECFAFSTLATNLSATVEWQLYQSADRSKTILYSADNDLVLARWTSD
ncbi:hypothetical protein Pan181_23810 [Aeoliella mucimassa]|uniref:Lipoprotein n=2 Tax=Aeoliella mucimassa TaxID=2527972 RepID=A0A518AN95_9BACT|nr:hypothetical protein Pan181_23810 [Aeoliella mucimassa]